MDKSKYRVHVRAIKTRIMVPGEGIRVFLRGYIFEKPWPDLISLAEQDIKCRVLRLEKIVLSENKAKEGAAK